MNVEIKVLDLLGYNMIDYIKKIERYYSVNNRTSPVHVDSLIMIYRITGNQMAFTLLFKCHKNLLYNLVKEKFDMYSRYLYNDDLEDLLAITYVEFYRRVLAYNIPPQAPFSKYIKLYIRRWINTYTKLLVKKRRREILNCDYYLEDNINE